MVLVVGVGGGLIGAGFVGMIHLLQRVLWPTHWADLSAPVHPGRASDLVVALLTRILGNPGDVELMVNNIHVLGGPDDISDLRSLIPVALLCISSGGAMGPEAPMVQTTGSLGAWLAGRWRLSVTETRILTITGMAAGFTVLFGAPLGSAIFALEILHRRGTGVLRGAASGRSGLTLGLRRRTWRSPDVGLQPIWHFPPVGALRGVDLVWALVAGRGRRRSEPSCSRTCHPGCCGSFRRIPPHGQTGDRRRRARGAGLLVALRADLRGGADQSARGPQGRWSRCSSWPRWPSCAGRP